MRISKGVLLVVLAMTVPFLVELRVIFGWIGIEVTALETVAIGAVVFGAVLLWAFLPENSDGEESDTDVSNESVRSPKN